MENHAKKYMVNISIRKDLSYRFVPNHDGDPLNLKFGESISEITKTKHILAVADEQFSILIDDKNDTAVFVGAIKTAEWLKFWD